MKARALCIEEPGTARIVETEVGPPAAGEVLVKTLACGVCAWDFKAYAGEIPLSYPYIGGHEGVGRVIEVGPGVYGFEEGDVVTTWSKRAFAEYYVVPAAKAEKLGPEHVPPEHWISEPPKCATTATLHLGLKPGDAVVLIGCGYMGLLHLQVLPKEWVRTLIAVDVSPERLAMARDFGADQTVQASPGCERETADAIARLLPDGADIAIEASGMPGTLDLATSVLRPGGTLSIYSFHSHAQRVDTGTWHLKGLRVLNTSPEIGRSSIDDFHRAVALMKRGVFRQERLISHRYPFEDSQSLFESMRVGRPKDYIKGVMVFGLG